MVFGDGKNDGLAGSGFLTRSKTQVILMGQAVELSHHFAVSVFVSPFFFELGRIVMFVINIGTFSDQDGNTSSELVGNQVTFLDSLNERKGVVGLVIFALVKPVGVAFDISGRCSGQANME